MMDRSERHLYVKWVITVKQIVTVGTKIKVGIHLSNCARKSYVKKATDTDISDFAKDQLIPLA